MNILKKMKLNQNVDNMFETINLNYNVDKTIETTWNLIKNVDKTN